MKQSDEIAMQCNDVYLNSESTVVIDAKNDALRHYLNHMHESLSFALRIECERAISDFESNLSQIISRHSQDIKDYINSNICDIITDKK